MARAFADYVQRSYEQRGWSLRDFAERAEPAETRDTSAGLASKILAGKNRKALLDRRRMERWADALRLDGGERERFLRLARLASTPEDIERDFLGLLSRVERLERALGAPDEQSGG